MSTRDVPLPQRFDYWVDMICSTYVGLDSEVETQADFFGGVSSLPLLDVELSIVQSNAPLVRRTKSKISQAEGEFVFVHSAQAGVAQVDHAGKSVRLRPGDITVYQSTEPYELRFGNWFDTRVLKIPLARLQQHAPRLHDRMATVIPHGSAEAATLKSLVHTAWLHGANGLSPALSTCLSSAMIQAVAAGLLTHGDDVARSALPDYHRARVHDYIERHLKEENLTLERVARGVGLSPRHLNRLFADEPASVPQLIWTRRLDKARDALLSQAPSCAIGAIAFEWGFTSQSHFCRAFKQRHGLSPSEFRQATRNAHSPTPAVRASQCGAPRAAQSKKP